MATNDALPLALLERGLNHTLRDSPAAARLLAQLNGQALALHAEELGRTLYLVAHPAGLQVLMQADRPAQATLSGTLFGLSRLAAGSASGRLPPGVRLSGEIEVAEQFQRLLARARPGFEGLQRRQVEQGIVQPVTQHHPGGLQDAQRGSEHRQGSFGVQSG